MSLSLSPVFDFVEVDHSKISDIHLDAIFRAPERQDSKRIPLHLILAIDVSGSMAGTKLESVKTTVDKLLDHLTENDTLGIITFSTEVQTVFETAPMTQANRELAKNIVKGLRDYSATNLSAALEVAIEKCATAEKNKVCRIVVLTDGLPTAGKSVHGDLVSIVNGMVDTVSLSTFGYGTDYNPELLLSLSNTGRGNHFYIEKSEDCNKAFALELGGLLSLYAQNIRVTVDPTGNTAITEFLSSYQFENKPGYRGITGSKLEFVIDDIYTGEAKHVMMKMQIPEATEAVCAGPFKVCTIKVTYMDVETKQNISFEETATIQYVKPGKVPAEANIEVKKQLVMIQAAKIQKEAKDKADAGDYAGAGVVLNKGIVWIQNNTWHDNSADIRNVFTTMASETSNRSVYLSGGLMAATAYSNAFSTSRGSSARSMRSKSVTYTSSTQASMLKEFGVSDDEVVPTIVTGSNSEKKDP
jgi:Ca-activated chloride channel family protein